ncbi:MAG: Mut7-C RNAse domain-containing protein [Smithellaceae bacterium]|nr:Mut7-C RNAse domain-containing protein [Smithellaceae bacterium]
MTKRSCREESKEAEAKGKPKFLVDSTLGRLPKWLRILGYDAVYQETGTDEEFLTRAAREGRLALTRKKNLAEPGAMIVVHDRAGEQIGEVITRLGLVPRRELFFSRCLVCNEPLQRIEKKDVATAVPPYVWENVEEFLKCPHCGRVFWPGTHKERAIDYLNSRILKGHP